MRTHANCITRNAWFQDSLPRRIAVSYEAAVHNPDCPEVRRAYNTLIRQAVEQYLAIPVRIELTPLDPYDDADEMCERVRLENCLRIYSLADFPRGHPLAEWVEVRIGWGSMKDSSYLPANCVFRAVHDWYGHIEPSYSFDAEGEECAYRRHYEMFTGDARLVLASETRGQNCWANFGPHLPYAPASLAEYRALPASRPYATQKAVILPAWAREVK